MYIVYLKCGREIFNTGSSCILKEALNIIVEFPALAECISLYSELSPILLSSGWIFSLVHMLTTAKGLWSLWLHSYSVLV